MAPTWSDQSLVEPMVVADVPRPAARRLQIRGRVDERDRRAERRDAVAREARVERALELVERAGRRRRPLVRTARTRRAGRRCRSVQQHRRADARRHVETIDDAVAIEPAAELEVPAGVRLKPILREERDVGAADRLRRRAREKSSRRASVPSARSISTGRLAGARVLVVQQIDADLEQVQPPGPVCDPDSD